MEEKVSFLKRKDIEISAKRYLQDALSAMALGLFGSLLIGVIFDTLGTQTANLFGDNAVSAFCVEIGGIAKTYMGAAIGVAVAWSLKAPPLVLFTSVVTGMMGATMTGFGIDVAGGPAGAFVAVALGAEFGKMVSKETKVDILVTPAVTLIMGGIGAKLIRPCHRLVHAEAGRSYHDGDRMAAVRIRDRDLRCSGTGSDSTDIQRGSLHHAGSFRSCCRRGDCRMLRADGRLRCSKL